MEQVERVVLFVVDGMRPDGMLQAQASTMHRLMESGSYTLAAQSVMPSVTLPAHMSMFHGVPPSVHGVTSNEWQPMHGAFIPSILDQARKCGKRPAMFYTWAQLRDLCRPGTLVYSMQIDIYDPADVDSEMEISRQAADYLVRRPPDLAFIYLGMVDETGHRFGWMSSEYLRAIEKADAGMTLVLGALRGAGLLDSTAILLAADHGGHAKGHGSDDPEDLTVPWIASGPGIRNGQALDVPVSIMDTAPTIAHLLGLPIPDAWQGRVVTEIFK